VSHLGFGFGFDCDSMRLGSPDGALRITAALLRNVPA
jgi:hypothetical protein